MNNKKLIIFLTILYISINIQCQNETFQGTFKSYDCSVEMQQDGENYYQNLYQAFSNAQHELLISGWKLIPETVLGVRGQAGNETFLKVVEKAVKRGVKVYLLYWTNDIITAFGHDWMGMRLKESTQEFRDVGAHVLIDAGRTWLPTFRWSQHQKFSIVDRQFAFVGGLDICMGRWDSNLHNFDEKFRFENDDAPNAFKNIKQFKPWHDYSVKITGEAVNDVVFNFLQRWQTYCSQFFIKTKDGCKKEQIPPTNFKPLQSTQPEIYKEKCMVTRSCGEWNCGIKTVETDIYKSVKWMINNAEHFLYLENQYIQSLPFSKNEVAQLIINKIKTKILAMEKFKVFIIFPLACEEKHLIMATRFTIYFGNEGFYKSLTEFIKNLKTDKTKSPEFQKWIQNIEYTDYIKINILGNVGYDQQQQWAGFRQIFVHAKLFIADDKIVSIGSANWNDRSFYGDRDSEINILIQPKNSVNGSLNGKPFLKGDYAFQMRKNLMKEHLGFSIKEYNQQVEELLEDPLSEKFEQFYDNISISNLKIVQDVFDLKFHLLDVDKDFETIASSWKKITVTNATKFEEIQKFKGQLMKYPLDAWGSDIKKASSIIDELPFLDDIFTFKIPEEHQ